MAAPINLNHVRKAKTRADKEATAAANRAKFGRSKREKAREAAERTITEKIIDAHKREP